MSHPMVKTKGMIYDILPVVAAFVLIGGFIVAAIALIGSIILDPNNGNDPCYEFYYEDTVLYYNHTLSYKELQDKISIMTDTSRAFQNVSFYLHEVRCIGD